MRTPAVIVLALSIALTGGEAYSQAPLTKADLSEYGMAYHADDCIPDPIDDVCQPVFHSTMGQSDDLPSFYKRLTVTVTGTQTFFYIRFDHLSRLPGGIPAVLTYGIFGPYPAGATVKVRKGASYYLVWKCSGAAEKSLISVSSDASDQAERVACG